MKFSKRTFKRTAKKAWKGVKTLTGNRYGRGTKQIITKGVPQLAKDVLALQKLINVEKKYIETTLTGQTVGQVYNNVTGSSISDITPAPSESVTYNGRTGQSIKLTGATIHLQLFEQSAQNVPAKIRFEIWYVKGTSATAASHLPLLYDVNPVTTVVDYLSDRQPNYFSEYKKVATRYVSFPAENYGAQTGRSKVIKMHLKLNSHVRFNKDTNTIVNGQIIILAFADSGNAGTVTSTLANITNQTALSGFYWSMYNRFYYVDN